MSKNEMKTYALVTRRVSEEMVTRRVRNALVTRRVSEAKVTRLVSFESCTFQARRADIPSAGGESHRFAYVDNKRPEGPTYAKLCRPSRP
jgi:hypothetical protein